MSHIAYPFSALVGQEPMQLALLLNAVNPSIGGVLIRGQKGTAKSTAARALATLLPAIETRPGCPFNCVPNQPTPACPVCNTGENRPTPTFRPTPFIELPVGASDDRVVGTLDIERALQSGQRHFEPGLLAQAHRGILYVDEVNLLADHIVDVLLDAAASGTNTVEREGVSVSHPARFILVGTMNPEEGELRPQLLDRFGLAVEVAGQIDPTLRTKVVRRRITFETDPAAFYENFVDQEKALGERILQAQQLLPTVTLSDGLLELISHICIGSQVDGLRADITMYKTAQTLAAWENRPTVAVDDIRRAAELVLLHRRRRQPFEEPGIDHQQLDNLIQQHQPPPGDRGNSERTQPDTPSPRDDTEGE
ncbi:MAG: ATP-binding protein [Anaerolineae bacterium]|nr:ATP-binding protein [Anaerolineae bacterium]